MGEIVLTSESYRISKIVYKTRAKVFSEFKEGDVIRFETVLTNTTKYSGGGGNMAADIRTVNITQGLSVWKSQSQLVNLLKTAFELTEVE